MNWLFIYFSSIQFAEQCRLLWTEFHQNLFCFDKCAIGLIEKKYLIYIIILIDSLALLQKLVSIYLPIYNVFLNQFFTIKQIKIVSFRACISFSSVYLLHLRRNKKYQFSSKRVTLHMKYSVFIFRYIFECNYEDYIQTKINFEEFQLICLLHCIRTS